MKHFAMSLTFWGFFLADSTEEVRQNLPFFKIGISGVARDGWALKNKFHRPLFCAKGGGLNLYILVLIFLLLEVHLF